MELGSILVKIAKNEQLSPQELDFVKRLGNETQTRNSQLAGMIGADGNLSLAKPYAQDMDFQVIPLGSIVYNGLSLGQQSIPHNTQTIIGNSTASQANAYTNKFFDISDDGSKLYIKRMVYRIMLYGDMTWDSNPTGYRSLRKYRYRADGSEIGWAALVRAQAVTTGATSYTWLSSQLIQGNLEIGDYISFKAFQTSGAALDLNDFTFGAFAIA